MGVRGEVAVYGHTKFTPTERRQYVLEWYVQGRKVQDIADELGISQQDTSELIADAQKEFLIDVNLKKRYLLQQLTEIEILRRKLFEILGHEHLLVQNGQIIAQRAGKDEDGEWIWEPLTDDMPKLAAMDRLIKLMERTARLLGLDSAEKLDVSAYVTFAVEGVDMEALR